MSGVKHTPGPWAVEDPMDHCLTIVANPEAPVYDWKWIATCDWPDEDNQLVTAREVKANARLIAAAPDLLEALEEFSREYDGFEDGNGDPCPVLAKARAAIARARGEQDGGGE